MARFDQTSGVGGGRAASGGSFYHLSFRSGSRASGASARAAHAYITRRDDYDSADRDPAVYTESDHMPAWAEEDPAAYWDAADLFERANGRLYVSADFALPLGLEVDDQVELARAFAKELTADEALPYTLAIHAGRDADEVEHNPHVHLMFSERQNDDLDRSREQWFRRANPEHPERGGAPKSRSFHGPAWVEHARERWAHLTNSTLARRGRDDRVDHRSYARQGLDREPGRHFGPAAASMVGRGDDHERLTDALTDREHDDLVRSVDGEIAALEAQRDALLSSSLDEEPERERRGAPGGFAADRSDDDGRGR